jgi:hypothetical protein
MAYSFYKPDFLSFQRFFVEKNKCWNRRMLGIILRREKLGARLKKQPGDANNPRVGSVLMPLCL